MDEKTKVGAVVGTGALLLGAVAGGAYGVHVGDDSKQVSNLTSELAAAQADISVFAEQLNMTTEELAVAASENEALKAELANVTPIVEVVNQTEYVEVDNEYLQEVLDFVYDENGNVEYITDDLDANEVDMIVDRIVFLNDAKQVAVDTVKRDFDYIVDKEYSNYGDRMSRDDIERVRVEAASETTVENIDFDFHDTDVLVEVKFVEDGRDYKALIRVEVENDKPVKSSTVWIRRD